MIKVISLWLGGVAMIYSGMLVSIDSFVAVGLALLIIGAAELSGVK